MDVRREHSVRLRELASWFRNFAERTENPTVAETRLRTADDLEREALAIEERSTSPSRTREELAL